MMDLRCGPCCKRVRSRARKSYCAFLILFFFSQDTPEGELPADFRPISKRKLFSVEMSERIGTQRQGGKTTGIKYKFVVKQEGRLRFPGKIVRVVCC